MSGVITKILVKPGAVVKAGDSIVFFEALKIEQEIKASADGKIATVNVFIGKKVEQGDVLVSIIPDK